MHGFKHGFSQFISYLFHPGIMPTVGALFVLWSVPETYSWSTIFKITSTVFVGTYASPLIAIVLFRATKIISSVHLIKREDRIYPYMTGAACAFATAAFLKKAMAPEEIYLSVYGTAFVLIVSTILIPYFKSSAHMAGATGFFALFLRLHQRYGLGGTDSLILLLLILSAVAWSRISLKRHTLQELLSGGLLGFSTVYTLLSH
jgi:membrane-associated phospholipid phosphatase|tara:strand:+ start:385 stop:993 length:609 start_codon:yes stop_codon:yes gene_type:complete